MKAARVGEPEPTPLPPVWAHLAVALEAWRENVEYEGVLEIAQRLGLAPFHRARLEGLLDGSVRR